MTVWLHIGLHRTGTTALQETFFPLLPNLLYLGWKGCQLPTEIRDDMRKLTYGLRLVSDREDAVQRMVAFYRARIARWNPAGLPHLLSEEAYSATSPLSRFDRLVVLPPVLKRLLGDDARVLLTVREPAALVVSLYEQRLLTLGVTYLRRNYQCSGPPSLKRFVSVDYDRHRRGAQETIFGSTVQFDRIVHAYGEAFGHDKFYVLPYEALRDRPGMFCGALCYLFGIPDIGLRPMVRNASSIERRHLILERFAVPLDSSNAKDFLSQFDTAVEEVRAMPPIAEYDARHCDGVRQRAENTLATLVAMDTDGTVR